MKCQLLVITGLLAVALVGGASGCNKGEKKTVEGEGGKKLTVRAPGNTSIQPGDTTSITVNVTREKFNDAVDLNFSGLPTGVKIKEIETVISKDVSFAKFTLQAAADSPPVEDQVVTVAAASGEMNENVNFKLTVKKASADKTTTAAKNEVAKLTLKTPSDVSLKQGDSAPVTIHIARDKFNDPVQLKFTGLPEGVSILENDTTISQDAHSAKLTLKATNGAKVVDDQPVMVFATGGGLMQDTMFKISVKKRS
jgi:hypothetical protein